MKSDLPSGWDWLPFEKLLETPLRNVIYKKKEFHGRGAKIVNMGELFAHPRLKGVDMKRVELTERELDKSSLQSGDLIFARRSLTAEGAGKCTIVLEVNELTTFESSIIRARLNKKIANPEFYYYLFNSNFGKWLLGIILRQVAVAGITGSDLAKLEVPVPPLDVQNKIATHSSSLDDIIELNCQINQTLEQIVQAIFKSWFVDFDPVKAKIEAKQNNQDPERAAMRAISGKTDEEINQLSPEYRQQFTAATGFFSDAIEASEIGDKPIDFMLGVFGHVLRPISERVGDQTAEIYSATVKGLELRDKKFNKKLSKSNAKNKKIKKGELVFGLSRQVLNFGLMTEEIGSVSPVYEIFEVDSKKYKPELLEMYIRQTMNRHMDILKPGAREGQAINRKYFLSKPLLIPPLKLQEKYIEITKPFFDLIKSNDLESVTLGNIRDSLLPKFLSGEINLSDTQPTVEAVAG